MHGNVWEWCADWYEGKLEGGIDPQGASSGSLRVGRGGCWYDYAYDCRVADRDRDIPSISGSSIGFRVARSSVQ